MSAVGVFLLAMFHSNVPSHDAENPMASISSQNFSGCGPHSDSANRVSPTAFKYAIDISNPTTAIGKVTKPCAVAHTIDVRDGSARNHRAL